MRLSDEAHTAKAWRIHEIAPDFRLEDVWELPTPGGPEDFGRLVDLMTTEDPGRTSSPAAAVLWQVRMRLGRLFGWDETAESGAVQATLRDRLPADLLQASGPEFASLPFTPLYLTDDEFAAEAANKTMHGVLHLGWVFDGRGGFRGQLAILVKPNGLLGTAYMAAIKPFRYLVVYPAMLRQIGMRWRTTTVGQDVGLPS